MTAGAVLAAGTELSTAMQIGIYFAYVGGAFFLAVGIYLSVKRGRPSALLLLCISAISFSWIEAPYDWATYAQFPPAMPRMPDWWPLNKTYGGLPAPVPPGYIAYFILPTVIAAYLGRRLVARTGWRRPQTLLVVGLGVGIIWAIGFNCFFGPRAGVFYYGRVIEGLAVFEGTKYQYPLYDAVAMGVQVMAFAYLLGRTDAEGRTIVEAWADRRTSSRGRSWALSIGAFVLIGHAVYFSVFAPHWITKEAGLVDVAVPGQLFDGVPNQPK